MSQYPFELPEPTGSQPLTLPDGLELFEQTESYNTYDEHAGHHLDKGAAIALGGLSLIGAEGHIVTTIGILRTYKDENEHVQLTGWGTHIGHPEERFRLMHHFDTKTDIETEDTGEAPQPGIGLPIPNYMTYFACKADAELAEATADPEQLGRIAEFIGKFVTDGATPQATDLPKN